METKNTQQIPVSVVVDGILASTDLVAREGSALRFKLPVLGLDTTKTFQNTDAAWNYAAERITAFGNKAAA